MDEGNTSVGDGSKRPKPSIKSPIFVKEIDKKIACFLGLILSLLFEGWLIYDQAKFFWVIFLVPVFLPLAALSWLLIGLAISRLTRRVKIKKIVVFLIMEVVSFGFAYFLLALDKMTIATDVLETLTPLKAAGWVAIQTAIHLIPNIITLYAGWYNNEDGKTPR